MSYLNQRLIICKSLRWIVMCSHAQSVPEWQQIARQPSSHVYVGLRQQCLMASAPSLRVVGRQVTQSYVLRPETIKKIMNTSLGEAE